MAQIYLLNSFLKRKINYVDPPCPITHENDQTKIVPDQNHSSSPKTHIINTNTVFFEKTPTPGAPGAIPQEQEQQQDTAEQALRRRLFGPVFAYATDHANLDHLHIYDDVVRRAELEALLRHLVDGGTMARVDSPLRRWSETPDHLWPSRELEQEADSEVLADASTPGTNGGKPSGGSRSTNGGSQVSGWSNRFAEYYGPDEPFSVVTGTSIVDSYLAGGPPPTTSAGGSGTHVRRRQHPHAAIPGSLTDANSGRLTFWNAGERMFKRHMMEMLTIMLPPMTAGVLTNFSQKCWSRTNQERLFDALHMAELRETLGMPPVEPTKERKAFFMRGVIWELMSSAMRPSVDVVGETLVELAIRRWCFELIFLETMRYMNKIQVVAELMEYPSPADLEALNLL